MDKIKYESLNSKQKETYNYHKVSAVLADYGYFTMRVTDDWESADFIATLEKLKPQLERLKPCHYTQVV